MNGKCEVNLLKSNLNNQKPLAQWIRFLYSNSSVTFHSWAFGWLQKHAIYIKLVFIAKNDIKLINIHFGIKKLKTANIASENSDVRIFSQDMIFTKKSREKFSQILIRITAIVSEVK